MAQCITCGAELHPERAVKYNYCTAKACQEKNAKGLTMVAIGMNKAADELVILDERTQADLASGRYRDQRRGPVGPPVASPAKMAPPAIPAQRPPAGVGPGGPGRRERRTGPSAGRGPERPRWTARQERLALLYNEQGLRPAEIADKLGVSEYLATQITLAARSRRKP